MKPTLLVLAAGMGSRYGGLKQLDGLGPDGQTIMDYSIYDAMRAGFGKVVFVIRKDFREAFEDRILSKYKSSIPVEVVFQAKESLPEGYPVPEGRERPWGTNHAVLMAKDVIKEPFAVINSDDFYGYGAFKTLADFLENLPSDSKGNYSMVAFRLSNTTTENGEVSRGVCRVDNEGKLSAITERQHIRYDNDRKLQYKDAEGNVEYLDENSPVSMNFWGFTPDYFEHSEKEFCRFLDKYLNDSKREFFIPSVVDKLINNEVASVRVLTTPSQWFGVTYNEDREGVMNRLAELHTAGEYPQNMFSDNR